MREIKAKYDESNDMIYTIDGSYIGVLKLTDKEKQPIEQVQAKPDVKSLVDLKDAGFTADEIMEMHKKGVL